MHALHTYIFGIVRVHIKNHSCDVFFFQSIALTNTRTTGSELGPKLFSPQIATIASFSCVSSYTKYTKEECVCVCAQCHVLQEHMK